MPRPTSDPPPDLAATAATYNPTSDQLCIGSALASMETGATLTATAQSGTTSPLPTTLTTPPTSWVQGTLSALARTYEHGLADVLGIILNWAISFGFMVVTPPDLTYQHHVVRALNAGLVGLMDGAVMLILVIAGYQAMLLHRPGDLQELIPRLVLATIIGNFSLFFLQQFIDLLNVLCTEAELLFGLAGIHVFTLPAGIGWTTTGEYIILTYLLDLVILVLLSPQMAARIALLDVFCILFALLPLLYVLRITRSWATFAMQAFFATLLRLPHW